MQKKCTMCGKLFTPVTSYTEVNCPDCQHSIDERIEKSNEIKFTNSADSIPSFKNSKFPDGVTFTPRHLNSKICAECGVEFIPTARMQKYCSDSCREAVKRRKKYQKQKEASEAQKAKIEKELHTHFEKNGTNEKLKEAEDMLVLYNEINHPEHYAYGGIETIEYMKAKSTPEEFRGHLRLTAIKYLSRFGHKDEILKELYKALWYVVRLIKELEADGK